MEEFLQKLLHSDHLKSEFTFIEEIRSADLSKSTYARLAESFSFMFVREPYSRLFSAYENKLYLPNKFWTQLGIDIINRVRNPRTSVDTGHDVTFSEMIQYVVIKHNFGESLNQHLEPMHERCNPCMVKFDFIGKLETMGKDIEFLGDHLQDSGVIERLTTYNNAEHIETEIRNNQWSGPVSKLYTILNTKQTNISINNLFLRTWSSYHIRGVILKQYEMPFVDNLMEITEQRYSAALTAAIEQSRDHKDELKLQKHEALVQAYRTVPLNLMHELRTFVKHDCQLFGYEEMPDKLFSRNSTPGNVFNYLKGL